MSKICIKTLISISKIAKASRSSLTQSILGRSLEEVEALDMDVEGLIASNIEAVRPGRTFPRQKRFEIPMSTSPGFTG